MSHPDLLLADAVSSCYDDPLRFVLMMYPWGEPGPLESYRGPDVWQRAALLEISRQVQSHRFNGHSPVQAVRIAISSGHGVGKSTLSAWLTNWIMSTRPHSQGTITANTFAQLETKTWAAIQRWTKLCLTRDWFTVTALRLYANSYKESWFCAPQSCHEDNSEAFAGQHAATSTSFYIFDEASAVPDAIYDVAEGGLTDGEPMIFLFGNPTRSSGAFHRACFGSSRSTWSPQIVDARHSSLTNKTQLQAWIDEYGEDSDFVRVRIKGLPPRASDLQYIGSDLVLAAQQRSVEPLPDDPLVVGLDVARGGDDMSVFCFRRGPDARSIPAIRIPGEQTRDSMRLITVAADLLSRPHDGRHIAMLFIDATGIGGPIADRLRQLGFRQVMDVQFGGQPPDRKYANMRAYMWGRLREWLQNLGAISSSPQLEADLIAPGYSHTTKEDRLILESKEHLKTRGVASPDEADALALTFAAPVGQSRRSVRQIPGPQAWQSEIGWLA